MKTRFKIILVIAIFALFYVTVPLFSQHCTQVSDNCEIMWFLMNNTRAGIVVDHLGDSDGIGSWSGTPEGIEEPTILQQFNVNIPFIQSMIIPPILIISGIVFWDKRK